MKVNLSGITTGTITRTVLTLLVILNLVLRFFGISPIDFDEGTIETAVEAIGSVAVIIWSWWKNNSITVAAQKADQILKNEKEAE